MASSYSSSLKIELMSTGENSGTWGTVTNTNLGTAMEQAVIGYGNPDYTSDANLTISITNSNASQAARCLVLNVTSVFGALTATRELIVPTSQKQYIVQNNTTGGQSITVKTSAGTGITVTNGRKAHLYVDGTNVIQMFDFVDINGGAIDGTPIGASSASTGAFTTLGATGNVTLGDADTDTITQAASYVTGTQLKSAKTATNTLSLAAYDVDGTAYTNLITLTAGNTPTLALTSTGVGTINNMSIGATTASTGAFTTLSASGTITQTATAATNTQAMLLTGATTGAHFIQMTNTSASALIGVEGSAGGYLSTGGSPYALQLRNTTGKDVQIAPNGTVMSTFSSTGLAVTGTFSSTLGATIQGLTVGLGGGAVSTNTAVGVSAIAATATGTYATAIGYNALTALTSGLYNTAVGGNALVANQGGTSNSAFGLSALGANVSGSNNTAVGVDALRFTTASNNTAVGFEAGKTNQTGTANVFVGYRAGLNATSNTNTFVGQESGFTVSTGAGNTIIGYGAGPNTATPGTGSQNTFVGYLSGNAMTSGAKNTIIGAFTGNGGGLDMRNASNWVVLSDGDGNMILNVQSAASIALQGNSSKAGIGITFPATQSASTDANTLDDYEEGTFTPAVSSGSGGPVVLSAATGQYTKIGNLVNFRLRVTVSNANSAGGTIEITGLPFTASSVITNRLRVVSADISNVTGSTTDSVGGSFIANGGTKISVLTSTSGNVTLTNTSSMDFNGTYFTA